MSRPWGGGEIEDPLGVPAGGERIGWMSAWMQRIVPKLGIDGEGLAERLDAEPSDAECDVVVP